MIIMRMHEMWVDIRPDDRISRIAEKDRKTERNKTGNDGNSWDRLASSGRAVDQCVEK